MTLLELIEDCARRGVELRITGEDLHVSAPVGSVTAAMREALRHYKSDLIGHLRKDPAAPHRSIGPAPTGADRSRLSVAQRSLWFLHELDPASLAAYVVRQVIRIEGDLDPARWAAALDLVVQRHDSLRTTFERFGGRPAARTHEGFATLLRNVDLRELSARDRDAALASLMDEDGCHVFDLCQGPLLRATLVRMTDSDWRFLVCAHHLIADAWSAGLVLREMLACYRGGGSDAPR